MVRKNLFIFSLVLFFLSGISQADVSEPAPDISLNIEGAEVPLSQFRGQLVLLDFWASWCGPCRQSFPWMNQMVNQYRSKGLKVIAVNVDQDQEAAAEFLQEVPANFDIAYDPAGEVAAQMEVSGMPMSFLIGPEGRILHRLVGFSAKRKALHEQHIRQRLSP